MKIRKIVLIETGAVDVHVYSRIPIPRLGSVLLGTILRDRGYDVSVYIEDMAPVDWTDVMSADLVGISTLTATAPRSYELAQRIRAAGIPVVIGGIHATFEAEEAAAHADYVLRGEAEESLLELIDTLESNTSLDRVPGLARKCDGTLVYGPAVAPITDLDRLPIPDFSLVQGWRRRAYVSVMTGRGCPFECTFCSVPAFHGRGPRMLSVERVLDEVAFHSARTSIRYLFFADDIFNFNRARMKEVLEGMIRRKLTPRWGAQVRHELSRDPEALDLMRRANCDRVFVGFESINPRTLERFNKHETRADVEQAIASFHRHGIKVHGMFVVGSDADTADTVRETEVFARRHDLDSLQLMILTPIPGSRDYGKMEQAGRLFTRDWSLYDGHHAVHEPEEMTAYEVQAEVTRGMQRFYSLGQAAKRALRGDWREAIIRVEAHRLVSTYAKHNVQYLESLRERLRDQLRIAGTTLQSVALPKLPDEGLRPIIEKFFSEMNVAVVHMIENAHDLLEEGRSHAGRKGSEARQALTRTLERLRGRVDCVIVPGEVLRSLVPPQPGLPGVVEVVAAANEAAYRQLLTKLGLLVTNDLEKIREAVRKALEAAPQPSLAPAS